MAIYHTCIFYPDITISMSAQTKENSASISEDKHKEILKYFPLLNDEIEDYKKSKDGFEVKFVSGGVYNTLANSQSSKGQRRKRLIVSRLY